MDASFFCAKKISNAINHLCQYTVNSRLFKSTCSFILQIAEKNIAATAETGEIADKKLSVLVVETGISAFAQPAKFLVPLTAFVHSLRIISLALQIIFLGEHFHLATQHVSSRFLSHPQGFCRVVIHTVNS